MGRYKKFNSTEQKKALHRSMGEAIENMIEEIKKPVDKELSGSARKAELQAIKQTAVDCKTLIRERDELGELIQQAYADQGALWDDEEDDEPKVKAAPDPNATKRKQGRPRKGEEVNPPKPEPPKISFSKKDEDFSAGFAEEFADD